MRERKLDEKPPEINISLARKRPAPKISFYSLLDSNLILQSLNSLSKEVEIEEFITLEQNDKKLDINPHPFLEYIISINWNMMFEKLNNISALITIGNFIYGILTRLKKWRYEGKVKHIRINCTASVSTAIGHLNRISPNINLGNLRLLYLTEKLGRFCFSIFSSPQLNPTELHIVVVDFDANVRDYQHIRI
jgi:hypothetical protein